MQQTTLIQPIDETGIAAIRHFAAQLAKSTGLRPCVSVDDTTKDVLFADESAAVVRIDWHWETRDDGLATWETQADEPADQSPQPAATIVAHYARQFKALAANPQAARALMTEPGRGRTGTRSPNKVRRRRRRKDGDS